MKGSYKVSERKSRQLLAHKERLRASMAQTYEAAKRWYDASQAQATPGLGDGGRSVGEIIEFRVATPEGHRSYVRWFDGTITPTWFTGQRLKSGTWVVVTSHWATERVQVQKGERVLIVDELLDTITPKDLQGYEDYWRFSKELDELELRDHLMIAPVETEAGVSEPDVGGAGESTLSITPVTSSNIDDELRRLGF